MVYMQFHLGPRVGDNMDAKTMFPGELTVLQMLLGNLTQVKLQAEVHSVQRVSISHGTINWQYA